MACNKKLTITNAGELDIDDLATTVDYFLGVRSITKISDWTTDYALVRIPSSKVMPNGNLDNVIAIETNNPALTVPEGQVRAGYTDTQPGGNVVRYADTAHMAQFIMLGKYVDGKMLIQNAGFVRIPAGHQYKVGLQYYTTENGEPTTDSSSGQKLFVPLDDYTLGLNLGS